MLSVYETPVKLNRAVPTLSVRLESWMVSIHIRENEEDEDRGDTITFFQERGQAELAIAWAAQVRLAEIQKRSGVSNIDLRYRVYVGSGDPEWKLVWWKREQGGYVAMKDYFNMRHAVFEQTVVQA